MKIYAVKISEISKEKMDELYELIDSEKKCRIEKFINTKDKIRTLIGEILIRTIVIDNLNIHNKCISFNKNQYGKPYLESYPSFNFNISHSGEYVLCAIDDKPIGVDVEEIKPIDCEGIVKSFFTEEEFEYIVSKELKFSLNRFYEILTLKESYIKCCGQGLSIPLSSFSIQIDQSKDIKVIKHNEYTQHAFKLFNIDSGYKVAVCSISKEICNNIIRLDQKCLIDKYTGVNIE
ncbi:4'-phosphopantetheinyl transferase family protein [Clostridium manihotivorum]|uniref:4-phosphopantetheinyl transferase n=1 Tax=Clostridium manihotivorum TaxID=2320868 RepID=A0A410DY22_9CLOT|nr:4'-phosphopantetheinyl transferase superfamily protein [Clostridium manihotivorum]QAA33941.1 4-phosphopantetheinyl transferase [Clostridium manihotivorum]